MNEKVEAILRAARDAYKQAVDCAETQNQVMANVQYGRLTGFEVALMILDEREAKEEVSDLINHLFKLNKQECAA